ncbi:MAG: polysaccharide biosynthesis tyrosine autokinase [Pseudomonadota bacterium]
MDLSRTPPSTPISPAPPAPEEDRLDLGALVPTLWRGKWLIALSTTLALLLGGLYAFGLATPLYRATTVLILETQPDQIVDLQSVAGGLTGDTTEINSELQVLRSRGLIGKVVDQLDLTTDPEFNSELRPPTLRKRLSSVLRTRITALLGQPSDAPPPLTAQQQAQRTRDIAISALIDQTSVSNVRQSYVINVTVESETAVKSARIADTIAALYIRDQIDIKLQATEQATRWLGRRVSELQRTLEEAEAQVSAFSADTDLVSVEALRALERQTKDLRDRIDAAEGDRTALAARISDLQRASDRPARAALAADPQLDRLLARADTDDAATAAFDARFDTLVTRAQVDLARADQQITALRQSETDLNQDIARQSDDMIALQQLTREAEAARVLYEYFLNRLNETAAQEGIQQADSRLLSNAVVPITPSQPRKSLILAMSCVAGALLAACFVLLREMRNQSFRTARDLEAATGHTVLGQIPLAPVRNRARLLAYLTDRPSSPTAEAYRNLRTSLMLSNADRPPQVIVSTSSVPGEGKTTNAIALAHNLAGMGKSVLLVEGDVRRRTFDQYVPGAPDTGLLSLLSGDTRLEDAISRPETLGVDVLSGGPVPRNAADLFASEPFRSLIAAARDRYDIILIDTPPVLVVPDARIIAEQADAVIFSVHWDKTSRQQVEEALRLIHSTGQTLSGLVLSQISPSGMRRYGHAGRRGAYAGYGSPYDAH